MANFAVRITAPRDKLIPVLGAWSSKCERILAYEHVETGKIHSHLLIMGCSQSTENLKNIARQNGLSLKGNGEWSFKTGYTDKVGKVKIELTENTKDKYVTYMSKGMYEPYYNKGYETKYLEDMKKEWVSPDPNKSKDAIVFEGFAKIMSAGGVDRDLTFAQVAGMARNYSFGRNNGIVNTQALKEAKMICLTYCYREQITIPWDKLKW